MRNPLERLVSAFRDKLSSPLNTSFVKSIFNFNKMKRSILEKYHPEQLKNWKKNNGSYELKLRFDTFIRWVIDMPNDRLNEHFSPMIINAIPCRIRYNFFANFKRMSEDMKLVTDRLGVPYSYYDTEGYYKPGKGTATLLEEYYSMVSNKLKKALFKDFYQEFDFYYHLFPEDRNSHISLLGITEL